MIKEALKIYNVTEADYRKWCKENKKPHYKTEVAKEYINYLKERKENEQNHNWKKKFILHC